MSDFARLARSFKQRAEKLEHVAEYVGDLPLVTEGTYGDPVDPPYDPNVDVRETIKRLREMAMLLSRLDYDVESATQDFNAAMVEFRDHDAARTDDAEEGYYDGLAWQDECRMLD
jgi:hypothetical protein